MYPSTYSTFNRPAASDRLNSPSHSALHNTTSSAVGQIEAVVGLNTGASASAVGTLMYDIRSPLSDGGGHVQTAVKGGTGQTTFSAGDLLVATGPSTISKLAVSSVVGDIIVADPNAAAKMKWQTNSTGTKLNINTATSSIYNTNAEQVLFAASVAGSILGTNNGIRFKGILTRYVNENQGAFTLRAKYGNNTIVTIPFPTTEAAFSSTVGRIEGMIVGHSSVAVQKGYLEMLTSSPASESAGALTVTMTKLMGFAVGSSSVNSSAEQNLVITGQFATANVASSVLTSFFALEKIM